jgi:deoxyribonuclease V
MREQMIIAAFDVHYLEDGRASGAAVLFSGYGDEEPSAVFTRFLPGAADYLPGEFYRRELPSILSLLAQIPETPAEMIIDGYVMLGERPGLGQHLFDLFEGRIPVIGVAKSKFPGSLGAEVLRGRSIRPLYVTSAGLNRKEASEKIRMMHGPHRIPTLLKRADLAARENSRQKHSPSIPLPTSEISGSFSLGNRKYHQPPSDPTVFRHQKALLFL